MNNTACASYPNVSSMMGVIVSRNMATLHELETVYSYEDALKLSEVIMVDNYNEWVAMEASKRK